MEENETTPSNGPRWLIIGGFAVVALLILVGLFLPPVSLGERLGFGGDETQEVTESAAPEATQVTADAIPAMPEGVALTLANGGDVSVEALAAADLAGDTVAAAAGEAMPADMAMLGDMYLLRFAGEQPTGQVAVPLPEGAAPYETLDLLGWLGSTWTFVPGRIDADAQKAVIDEGPLPLALVLARSEGPDTPTVSMEVEPGQEQPVETAPMVNEVTIPALLLNPDGVLEGEVAPAAQGADHLLQASNRAAIVDQAALANLLNTPAAQDAQIAQLVEKATNNGFGGVHLDYQGVAASQAEAFTAFVSKLNDALDAENLKLVLTLATPAAAGSTWDTGGQQWAELGRLADAVYLQMPLDPAAYAEGGLAEQLLLWATDKIDRHKLTLLADAGAVARVGETFTALDSERILSNFGSLMTADGTTEVEVDTSVDVMLDGATSGLEWDGASLAYRYTIDQDGQPQTVWLNSEAALAHRLRLADKFNVRGVSLEGMDELSSITGLAAVLNNLMGSGEAPQAGGAAIAWTVRDESDSVLASNTSEGLSFTWDGAAEPGTYNVSADLVVGDRVAPLGTLALVVGGDELAQVEEAEAEAAAEIELAEAQPEEEEEVVVEAPSSAALAAGTGTVGVGANVRVGPGLGYGTLLGGVGPGTVFELIGRSDDNSWINIRLPDGQEGWIFGQLVTTSSGFDINSLAVVAAPPLAAPPAASGGNEGAAAPPPAAAAPPAPVGNVGNFELGGQAAGMPAGTMSYAGMTWVKKQHKWNPGDPPEAVAGLINEAHNAGFKILLAIPGQLNPTSIDFAAYTEFLRGVAALGPDAIEVWNEMNIDREWPIGQIDPGSYVNNMLRPAYNAIKSVNPNVMVIAGAPAPTGFFNGCGPNGCDDAPYVAGMMAAGAGSVSDCVGVHYNEGLLPPAATSGDPRGSGGHYTRYFQGMINAYAAAGASRLCFTEIGYLSGEEWGTLPSGFLWRPPYNLSVAEHAQYLGEAVRVAVNSGLVRLMIVFNVDFTHWSADPQAGYAMIRPDGSCPACETLRAVMGQ